MLCEILCLTCLHDLEGGRVNDDVLSLICVSVEDSTKKKKVKKRNFINKSLFYLYQSTITIHVCIVSRSRGKESLSDSQIVQMRLQVQQQRLKVEEERYAPKSFLSLSLSIDVLSTLTVLMVVVSGGGLLVLYI